MFEFGWIIFGFKEWKFNNGWNLWKIKYYKFYIIGNIVDSFLLITKVLTGLVCAVLCKTIISLKYFSNEMYEGNVTCLIAALIGYYIASIYF
jgi:uncharacterized membrane protein YeaQ/YmgE (transglycosylase-associated protein family)